MELERTLKKLPQAVELEKTLRSQTELRGWTKGGMLEAGPPLEETTGYPYIRALMEDDCLTADKPYFPKDRKNAPFTFHNTLGRKGGRTSRSTVGTEKRGTVPIPVGLA